MLLGRLALTKRVAVVLALAVTGSLALLALQSLLADPAHAQSTADQLGPLAQVGVAPTLTERVAQRLSNGIRIGLIIAMCSVGLSLIFGTTGLVNFAHGELVTMGALIALGLNAGRTGLDVIPAAAIAVVATGTFGGLMETSLWRPLRRRRVGLFQLLVITIGISLAMRNLFLILAGSSPQPYRDYVNQTQFELGPVSLTPRDATLVVASIAILVAVAVILQKTRAGKAVRAVSDDIDLAESSGIDVQRVIRQLWVAGAALAATGGVFFGLSVDVRFDMGFRLLLQIFAAVILGGLGTAYGAMVGGLTIGVVSEMSTLWFSGELKELWALVVLVLVLLVRPQGILGQRERVG